MLASLWHKSAPQLKGLLLILGLSVIASNDAGALRRVLFEIVLDGKVVLEASTGDSGEARRDAVWLYLKRMPLRPLEQARSGAVVPGFRVQPDPVDALRATLRGRIEIRSYYAGRSAVAELQLVRDSTESPWFIAAHEVERTLSLRSPEPAQPDRPSPP